MQIEFLKVAGLLGLALPMVSGLGLAWLIKNEVTKEVNWNNQHSAETHQPRKSIGFDSKNSQLVIDGNTVAIAYASNQYYFCKAIFAKPKKRWEHDELLEKFGEDIMDDNFKKVYDTALAINRKVGFKLIVYSDRTYSLNKDFATLVKVIH